MTSRPFIAPTLLAFVWFTGCLGADLASELVDEILDDETGGQGSPCLAISPCDEDITGAEELPPPTEGANDAADGQDISADQDGDNDTDADTALLSEDSEDDPQACDDTVDADGDGLACDCDANDDRARNTTVVSACDTDGDGVPPPYDPCPLHDDTDDVVVILLCDEQTEVDEDGTLLIEVDYDSERWTGEDCAGPRGVDAGADAGRIAANDGLPDDGVVIPAAAVMDLRQDVVDFPIAYLYPDKNNNDIADCQRGSIIVVAPQIILDQGVMTASPIN